MEHIQESWEHIIVENKPEAALPNPMEEVATHIRVGWVLHHAPEDRFKTGEATQARPESENYTQKILHIIPSLQSIETIKQHKGAEYGTQTNSKTKTRPPLVSTKKENHEKHISA